jgi:HdeA/HdeB family
MNRRRRIGEEIMRILRQLRLCAVVLVASASAGYVGPYPNQTNKTGRAIQVLPALFCLGLLLLGSRPVDAQETTDISKLTCDQFIAGTVSDSRTISVWINGYYNGARGTTLIDPNVTGEKSLIQYCIGQPKMPVLDAARNVGGAFK